MVTASRRHDEDRHEEDRHDEVRHDEVQDLDVSEDRHHVDEDDGYVGPALVVTANGEVHVRVHLAGFFQPVDGRYHWYGRVASDRRLDELIGSKSDVVIRTPHGSAVARAGDRNLWGRYRLDGTSTPPFPVSTTLSFDVGD